MWQFHWLKSSSYLWATFTNNKRNFIPKKEVMILIIAQWINELQLLTILISLNKFSYIQKWVFSEIYSGDLRQLFELLFMQVVHIHFSLISMFRKSNIVCKILKRLIILMNFLSDKIFKQWPNKIIMLKNLHSI